MGLEVEHRTYNRSSPGAKVDLLYHYRLPLQPGYSIVSLRVVFPPGGSSPPHRHGNAAVAVYVQSGRHYNRMNDGPTELQEAGETFFERPGCHHRTSENVSTTEELVLIATMTVESDVIEQQGIAGLVIVDEEYRS